MENLRSTGLLIIARELKEELITEGGLIVPENDRTSIPLRAEVLSAPIKTIQNGVLPGDTVLFTAQTREKITIEFTPKLGGESLLGIPPECVVCAIPATDEIRQMAIMNIKEQFDPALLELISYFGAIESTSVKNIRQYQ